MKNEKIVRAYDRALPPEETKNRLLFAVLRENGAASPSERSRTMKRRPIWRTVLIAALAVMLLAALATGGYAAVRRWTMPEPTYYTPNETGGSVEIHDTAVYHEKDLESEDPFSETDTAENRKPSDEELIRDAVALFRTLGMEDAKSEEMTVVHQTELWYPREETVIHFERGEIQTNVTYNGETGKFLKLDGFDFAMLPGTPCESETEAEACARSFYEKLPVERGYALTPGVEKYDDDLWMYEFCREVEPGLYSYYEMVRITINPETGRLVLANVFYFPLLDDHGEDPALTEEQAIAALEAFRDVTGFTLVESRVGIVLPNWWWSEKDSSLNAQFSKVTRWAWVLRYKAPQSFYEYDDEYYVDLYTGEILGGNSVG